MAWLEEPEGADEAQEPQRMVVSFKDGKVDVPLEPVAGEGNDTTHLIRLG